ncbi:MULTISPECIES: hypothetical protein [Methylobacterium]|jgi:hypothetical protein|uniref:hypothetical protein n=1 Tax=Methylobacterium TaxID=407 RepID=UPI001113FEF3|nr:MULTISPECIES: hypothetical protein [Methylobacterium]MBK3400604.1 hypothetical protein [Methylobacterium ajmalii]MBK3408880.1 hypothetical protein [Methylobacterium ajmalii]MBK3422322.1 hypothetical protein [Methylobacterium ajmalii]MBZ6414978.1 hypothetical protein [Methylobacterium sp.]
MSNTITTSNLSSTPLLRGLAGGAQASTSNETSASRSSVGPATVVELSASAKAVSSTSPGQKDFATVAKDARGALDASYTKAGKTSSIYTTAAEVRDMFSGLDRRALYAIKSNEGGKFSAVEQDMAKTEMRDRLHADTGIDVINVDGKLAPGLKKVINYLDNVSIEEKGSFDWAKQRGEAQADYEARSRFEGEEPEKIDSTNPAVKLIKAALDSLKALNDPSKRVEDMPQYKQAQQLFDGQQRIEAPGVDVKV